MGICGNDLGKNVHMGGVNDWKQYDASISLESEPFSNAKISFWLEATL